MGQPEHVTRNHIVGLFFGIITGRYVMAKRDRWIDGSMIDRYRTPGPVKALLTQNGFAYQGKQACLPAIRRKVLQKNIE